MATRNVKGKAVSDAARRISSLVGSLTLLKETLELLPGMAQPLDECQSELLQAIGASCNHEVFQSLLEAVASALDEVQLLLSMT